MANIFYKCASKNRKCNSNNATHNKWNIYDNTNLGSKSTNAR